MDDYELLQAYAGRRVEDAFETLTDRYLGLVFSAAMRQTQNAQAAEDVTQAVFLTLAQKAGTISRKVVLAGWLLRATRYAAANARRLEQRRQHYEQEAMQSQVQITEADATWQRIAPLLDEAVDDLPERDRRAVVLRFFEGMSLKDVAVRIGTTEDAVQKRTSRALEKLRVFFQRRGRAVSVGALATAITAHAVQAAPPIVVRAASQAAQTIARATVDTIARVRLQTLAVRAGSVVILLGVAVLPMLRFRTAGPVPPAVNAAPQPERLKAAVQAFGVPPSGGPPSESKQLLLRVIDSQSGAPVANARLSLVSAKESSSRTTNSFATDVNGTGLVAYSPVPISRWSHRIEIFHDGYVPKFVSWSEYQQDRIEEIPSDYTAKVDPAVTIGGVVTDEEGVPVPEARVVFTVLGPTPSRSRERLTMMGNYHTEVTDANGRWTCSHVPARFGMITFKPTHPQFQDKTFVSDSPEAPSFRDANRIPESDFLAGRAAMRLQRGLVIAGIVTDESGQPVAGAKVTQNYGYRDPERYRIAGADGSFRFDNGRPTELALTLQAANFAPVVTSFVANASVEPLRLVLPRGVRLEGRVVDEHGEGIAGASIEAASPRADSTTLFEWRTKTDDKGRFSWDTAPAVQEYAVNAGGYELEKRVKLRAGVEEQTVRLIKSASTATVRILGQLLDAETRQPLASGRIQIWQTMKDRGRVVSSFTTTAEAVDAAGKFRLQTSSGTFSYVLEAQADGYWPKRLTNQVTGDAEVWLDLALPKADAMVGMVLTPAGEPAKGARLVVCGPSDWAPMNRPGLFQVSAGARAATTLADTQGVFRLPPKHDPHIVAVAHPEGFIEAPFSQMTSNSRITLQRWSRIEGNARLGGKPLVNQPIHVGGRMNKSSRVSVSMTVNTDENGHFVFEAVPPGQWRVQREINKPEVQRATVRVSAFSHGVSVEVASGETANVIIGGNGGAVIGRAIAPAALTPDVWRENSVALIKQDSPAEYRAMFAADGSFRIEDVPPGDYTLKVNLTEPANRADGNLPNFKPIASLEEPVTIPARSETDLGTLELRFSSARGQLRQGGGLAPR